MDTGGLGDLVQQAQQLTAQIDSGYELPRVERNLYQILDEAQRMAGRTPAATHDSTDIKASLLLGSRGYDVQRVASKLEGLSSAKTFEPLEPVRDTDIHGFLKNERENALLSAIEQARKNTFEETERSHWESMESEWEREKQRILNALVGSSQDMMDFPQDESILSDSVHLGGRSTMDQVEMAYARQIYVYNDQLVQGGIKPSLAHLFAEAAQKFDDQSVSEVWSMIRYLTEVPVSLQGSVQKARSSNDMQQAFVRQALKYLEESYIKYLDTVVSSNLQLAERGGIPGTYNLVRSFLKIKLPHIPQGIQDGTVDGQPVWAMIYYCIRCGNMQAAMQVIQQAQANLGDFERYFKEYMNNDERRLSVHSEREIRLQYRRSIRNASDPFKKAVFAIIGRCNSDEDHSDVAEKTEDWLWMKLCQITFTDDDDAEKLTLPNLQTLLLENYGESHFSAYQQPFLYFRMLLLTAQFEPAIEFLSRFDKLRCHAVHMAVVLYELNMLIMPNTIQAQLLCRESSDPEPIRRLNFARLIMMYTRKFEVTDPREALQYFYILRNVKTAQGENLFMSCVSELVLDTREFDMLLGQLGRDGSRKPGAIDKFKLDTQKIIELVAKDTEDKGLFEDAVRLYDLAKKHSKVLELLNKLLTQVLSQPPSPQSTKDRLKQMAVSVAQRYNELGVRANPGHTSTFHLLLDLMTFFDFYHTNKYDQAYGVMKELKLLPLTVEQVEQKVSAFRNYSDEIRRSLPDIMLSLMNILHTQYKNAKQSSPAVMSPLGSRSLGGSYIEDGGKQSFITYLRSQAKALITFAGMIPYRMPGDTNARLVQLEVLMN